MPKVLGVSQGSRGFRPISAGPMGFPFASGAVPNTLPMPIEAVLDVRICRLRDSHGRRVAPPDRRSFRGVASPASTRPPIDRVLVRVPLEGVPLEDVPLEDVPLEDVPLEERNTHDCPHRRIRSPCPSARRLRRRRHRAAASAAAAGRAANDGTPRRGPDRQRWAAGSRHQWRADRAGTHSAARRRRLRDQGCSWRCDRRGDRGAEPLAGATHAGARAAASDDRRGARADRSGACSASQTRSGDRHDGRRGDGRLARDGGRPRPRRPASRDRRRVGIDRADRRGRGTPRPRR